MLDQTFTVKRNGLVPDPAWPVHRSRWHLRGLRHRRRTGTGSWGVGAVSGDGFTTESWDFMISLRKNGVLSPSNIEDV